MSESAQCEYVMPENHNEWYYRGKRCRQGVDEGEQFCWRHGQECVNCGRRCSHIGGGLCAKCNSKPNKPAPPPGVEQMIEELLKDGDCACELSIRYDAALDAYSVRLLDEDRETVVGRFRSSVQAGIQDVSGAWRERE